MSVHSCRLAVLELIVSASLISASRVKKCFPDVDDDVLSLIPRTNGKRPASVRDALY